MKLKPLNSNLIISVEYEETTKSGIVLPDTADKERPEKGKVVAVGPGKLDEKGNRLPMVIKKGDIVLFKKYAPDEIDYNGKRYLILDESDVLAVEE